MGVLKGHVQLECLHFSPQGSPPFLSPRDKSSKLENVGTRDGAEKEKTGLKKMHDCPKPDTYLLGKVPRGEWGT